MYCVFTSVTLYAEFLPCKQRAKCVVLLDVSLGISNIEIDNDMFVVITYYYILIKIKAI